MRTVVVKRPPDLFAAPAFAWARVGVMAALSAAGLLFTPDAEGSRLFFALMTFAGLPAALLLLATLTRLQPRTHALLSAAADLSAAVSLHALVEDGAQVARLAYVVIGAIVAITAGFLPGLAFTVVSAAINAVIDLVDADSLAGDFNPVVHVVRFGMAVLLVYLVARATDDRRRAQASQRAASVKADTILSKVSSAVVVTDRGGRILEWNDAAAGVMQMPEQEAAHGLRCENALGLSVDGQPLDCRNGCGLLRLRQEYPERDLPEVFRLLPDGRKQPLAADAAAITDADGRTLEIVHSLLDVTRLKQADEAKTLFLATTSHELKTPLTVIGGFAELLLSMPDLPESQRRDALQTIHRRAGELGSIVDRLLLSSRIESGKIQLNLEPIDVVPVIRERVEALGRATGREVVVTVQGEIPRAEADLSAVAAIVDHLLENAIRYSPGGERVDAVVTCAENFVEIVVRDRGIGMDSHQQEKCFERFWQAESTDVRRFGGTGIGLYIVKSLAEAMAGSVVVQSKLGRGSTFTLRLPAVEPINADEERAALGEVLDAVNASGGGGQ